MRKLVLFISFITVSLNCSSQKVDLLKFEKERTTISRNSMLVLGGWSVLNIVGSGLATKTHNSEVRHFHQMNVMWGSINLAIAGLGYIGNANAKFNNPTMASVLKHQRGVEKTYLINGGLDVLYIGAGLWMNKAADNQKRPDRFKGWGNSIMVQGGFLLIYDAINYAIHRKHGKKLNGAVDKVSLSGGLGSVSLAYNF
jgi:hypothetical protein